MFCLTHGVYPKIDIISNECIQTDEIQNTGLKGFSYSKFRKLLTHPYTICASSEARHSLKNIDCAVYSPFEDKDSTQMVSSDASHHYKRSLSPSLHLCPIYATLPELPSFFFVVSVLNSKNTVVISHSVNFPVLK